MDKLYEEFFKDERWEKAIAIAVDKNMPHDKLEAMCNPKFREGLAILLKNNLYNIERPHQQAIPKDDGGTRIVYINEYRDRVILSIINDMLFEFCGSLISERSKAYQTDLSCGKVVREVVSRIAGCKLQTIGIKADLSKYFDGVPSGIKLNPKAKVISTSDKVVSHTTVEHGFVRPHFRNGYFRHFNSDYFVNCKGQVRFIAATMVKGKAKTVINK